MVNAPDASSSSASNHGGYYGSGLRLVVPSLWGRQTSEAATEQEFHRGEPTTVEDVGIVARGTSSSSRSSQAPSHGPQHHVGRLDAPPPVRPPHVPHHHHHHHPYVSPQPEATPHQPHPPSARSVRAVFDGLMSPFLSCVQPPLAACVPSAVGTWDYQSRNSSYGVRSCEDYDDGGDDGCTSVVLYPVPSTPPPRPSAFVAPRYHDVVCGRGGGNARHPGNQNFRDLVAANKRIYATLTKKQKMTMAQQIVDAVHSTRPPGRFLARDPRTGLWEDIGVPRSLEKASQAFRDTASETPESSELSTDPPDVITPTTLSPAPFHTPKSNRTSPPPPPILIPAHLQSVFRQPSVPVHADLPPSPSPYLQTPMLVETPSSSASSVQSDQHHQLTPTVRFPPFRSSSAPVDATLPATPRSSSSRPSSMLTPASTPGQRRGPRRRRLPPGVAATSNLPSFEEGHSAAIPMFTDEPESPIELAYSYSNSQGCDPREGRPKATPCIPRWPDATTDDGMSSSSAAASLSSSFSGAWLPPPGGGLSAGGRPLFSPSGLLQGRHDRPRHRFSSAASATSSVSSVHLHSHHPHHNQQHSLPLPPPQQQQMLPQLWDDPDGMDGLVALSTAAFLRLDETD